MKVLVTGASGFVGEWLVKELAQQAHERPTARELIYESLRWFWLALPLQGLRKFKAFNGLYMRLKNQRSKDTTILQ